MMCEVFFYAIIHHALRKSRIHHKQNGKRIIITKLVPLELQVK